MPDEIDLANEQSERWLNQALANIGKGGPRLAPRGSCHYCETDFDPKTDPDAARKLFCDGECSHDYEEEQRLRNRR